MSVNKTVQMKGKISGTRNGTDWPPVGGTVELPEEEANRLIASGLATEAKPAPAIPEVVAQILAADEDALAGTPAEKETITAKAETATAAEAVKAPGAARRASNHSPAQDAPEPGGAKG